MIPREKLAHFESLTILRLGGPRGEGARRIHFEAQNTVAILFKHCISNKQ